MTFTTMSEKVVAGDDISINLVTAEDNTGYTAESKLENSSNVVVAIFDVTLNPPYSIVLTLDSADTIGLAPGKYNWNVKIISPTLKKTTIIVGNIEILATT